MCFADAVIPAEAGICLSIKKMKFDLFPRLRGDNDLFAKRVDEL